MNEMLSVLREIRDERVAQGMNATADRDRWRDGSPYYNLHNSVVYEAQAQVTALDRAITTIEEVTRLREWNTRLKVALKPFAELDLDDEDAPDDWDESYDIYAGDIRRARAAREEG